METEGTIPDSHESEISPLKLAKLIEQPESVSVLMSPPVRLVVKISRVSWNYTIQSWIFKDNILYSHCHQKQSFEKLTIQPIPGYTLLCNNLKLAVISYSTLNILTVTALCFKDPAQLSEIKEPIFLRMFAK